MTPTDILDLYGFLKWWIKAAGLVLLILMFTLLIIRDKGEY